jgi:hypothetical protein
MACRNHVILPDLQSCIDCLRDEYTIADGHLRDLLAMIKHMREQGYGPQIEAAAVWLADKKREAK